MFSKLFPSKYKLNKEAEHYLKMYNLEVKKRTEEILINILAVIVIIFVVTCFVWNISENIELDARIDKAQCTLDSLNTILERPW